MPRCRRFWGKDTDAVAQVVGAVLVFALVSMMFVVVRTEFVPQWERDAEADHMQSLMAAMAEAQAQAQRLVGNASLDAAQVTLGAIPSAAWDMFSSDPRGARLTFTPGAQAGALASTQLRVQAQNGTVLLPENEEWVAFAAGPTVADVVQVDHLRLRVANPQAQPDGASATLAIRDVHGRYAGEIKVRAETFPSGYTMKTTIRSAAGAVLYDQGESFFNQDRPPFYWVDALRTEAPFGQVVATASGPLQLVLTKDRLDAQYSLVFTRGAATGGGLAGSAGALRADWTVPVSGGALLVDSRNQHYPDRQIRLEGGALFLTQSDGSILRTPPGLEVRRVGALTHVSLALPMLRGDWDARDDTVPVKMSFSVVQRSSLLGTAPDWSIMVATGRPDLWRASLDQAAAAGGLSATAGEYAVETGPGWARLQVFGVTSGTGSAVHDLVIDMRLVSIDVRLS